MENTENTQNPKKPNMKWLRPVGAVFFAVCILAAGFGGGMYYKSWQNRNSDTITVSKADKADYELIQQAWDDIQTKYVDQSVVSSQLLAYGAISGMVDSLGDTGHSVFLTPAEVQQENQAIAGKLDGIGAEVSEKNGNVVVVAPIDGSPAQKAGLQSGDIILKVDGTAVTGVQDAVTRIRGTPGTSVTINILTPAGNTTDLTIVRAEIHINSVVWQMLPGTTIADLRISSFSDGTSAALDTALTAIKAQGATAIVLDLRDNPGGLLNEAEGVASRFLTGGDVLEEKDINGNIKKDAVLSNVTKTDLPMTVLVNGGTASAAEIVSGALQDRGRAKVIGQNTFGTGTALVGYSLTDGSEVVLGVSEWLTPSGKSIWHTGLTPDTVVALATGVSPLLPEAINGMTAAQLQASGDTQLLDAINLLQQ
ncbi:MAG TPA: S41 family peptidase [Dehalococcoidales bacterium]|jgi:C-terminal peptidase (prc)|nr:S41 family peptidase [Dehalococcoidales bacterium]